MDMHVLLSLWLFNEHDSYSSSPSSFQKLFEKSTKDHAGVVAMGLLAPPAGILQTMLLCEIESFQSMEGDTGFGTSFSILATIRAVGRGSLVYIQDEDEEAEYLRGWCTEVCDDTSSESGRNGNKKDVLEIGNGIADRLDKVFNSIIGLEEELSQLQEGIDDENFMAAAMRRRVLEAELDEDIHEDDDEDDDDEDDDDDDDDEYENVRSRLQKAFQIAKSSDMQGYRISSTDPETSSKKMRSIQDLTALSWAYFSCGLESEEMITFRLRSLEVVDLCERLKLALVMMMEHRSKVKATLKSTRGDDSNED